MKTSYLKCKYFENSPIMTFQREYVVTFKCLKNYNGKLLIGDYLFPPEGEEWCVVNRQEVKKIDDINGLARIIAIREGEDKKSCYVGRKDDGDRRISFFKVPVSEIETIE